MNYIKTKIIAGILLIIIASAVIFSITDKKYERYVMFFKNSVTSKVEAEIRYVPVQNIEDASVYFFKELMLGPVNHDYYPFLKSGKPVLSCFVKNNTLYADLPASFMESIDDGIDSEDIKFLFFKNIFVNCKNLEAAYIYVEGVQIYELLKNNAEI